eukprot:TRINITY_DN7828_c0_g1_i1.p1 TRINITY_DN7828_c0_g1~~TRINITY_DN7828_c0_g1_i1.p1  ORF type:complete len:525 (-),score=91.45 TRINITY_DN7828_c0_g1_i1:71-1573(-)
MAARGYRDGTKPKFAIIGAGVSGICAAVQIRKQLGVDSLITIFEFEDEVGGTWYRNQYPGCACDVESHLYSFSFAPNPEWNELYSSQPEILAYLKKVCKDFDLYKLIAFKTEVLEARWDDDQRVWILSVKNRDTNETTVVEANFLISSSNAFGNPSTPEKFRSFEGPTYHTAKWDKNYDLTGKNVAVVGNGASGIQLIPTIAKQAKHLSVYQRTASWVLDRNNYQYSWITKTLFRYVPGLTWAYRSFLYFRKEFLVFPGLLRGGFFSKLFTKMSLRMLEKQVPNEEIRKKLIPNYELGCKRVCISDDYYPTFMRDNVDLITDPIIQVEKNIIKTANTEEKVDALILATGFTMYAYLFPMKIYGLKNVELSEHWNFDTYYGIITNNFPNFFLLLGPNTALGHNTVIFMIECQVNYILKMIKYMLRHDFDSVNVSKKAQDDFLSQLHVDLERTVFVSECQSWYKKDGKIFTLWSSNSLSYYYRTLFVKHSDFEFTKKSKYTL